MPADLRPVDRHNPKPPPPLNTVRLEIRMVHGENRGQEKGGTDGTFAAAAAPGKERSVRPPLP